MGAVHVSEFEKLTTMTDGDASQHLHVCGVTKLVREKSDVAASEDRARAGNASPLSGSNGAHRINYDTSDIHDANADCMQNSNVSVQNIRLRLEGLIAGVVITLGLLVILRCFSSLNSRGTSDL